MPINRIISHRGASAYAPENTMASFEKSLSLGCYHIEFDVVLSADGEVFVFHDECLERTTNGQGEIGCVNSAYLRRLDAGSWFAKAFCNERIPLFADVLSWASQHRVSLNIEIKPYPGRAYLTASTIVKIIRDIWPNTLPLPLLSSFDRLTLDTCQEIAPQMPLGLLLDEWETHWQHIARRINCSSIHLNHALLTAERIKEVKQQGYTLLAYTVNSAEEAKRFFHLGVDGLFTDHPDILSR